MKYVYPAIFHPLEDRTDGYMVTFPDIPGCLTEGFSLNEALYMAHDALYQMMAYYESAGIKPDRLPTPIRDLKMEGNEFPTLISVETRDEQPVRKIVSLPKWMVEQASEKHISLSDLLQRAHLERLST